jgi:hypothetical protein
MAEAVVFDLELQNNEAQPANGPKNNSDSDDEVLEIEEVRYYYYYYYLYVLFYITILFVSVEYRSTETVCLPR